MRSKALSCYRKLHHNQLCQRFNVVRPRHVWLSLFLLVVGAAVLPAASSRLQAQTQEKSASSGTVSTVVDMTERDLRRKYSAWLQGVEFGSDRDEGASILINAGKRVEAFFRDFSSTIAKEEVVLQRLGKRDYVLDAVTQQFSYMILSRPDAESPGLEEYRTDRNNRPVDQDQFTGFFITSGYACLNLVFHPDFQDRSRFRYLGRTTSGSRAHVIAFAERTESGKPLVNYSDILSGESTRFPLEGMAWVDPETFQILLMRTNLLIGAGSHPLREQTAEIRFRDVSFEETGQQFRLPGEVTVIMVVRDRMFRNYHRYSDYRLFTVKSKIVSEPETLHGYYND
jgi:hypothetical protein